jgi:DNA-directed RNA polymerase specialized sigma24 family protein
MNPQGLDRYYADNIGLIHTVAGKGYRRLMGIGACIDYDDLVQELSLVFVKAYAKFDEGRGKFSTYFTSSAYNELNEIAAKFEKERIEMRVASIEEMDRWENTELGVLSVEEKIACLDATPEARCETMSSLAQMFEGLTPLAEFILEAVINPPDYMEAEFRAASAHAEFARNSGIAKRNRRAMIISVNFVCDVLLKTKDFLPSQLTSAKEELMTAASRSLR